MTEEAPRRARWRRYGPGIGIGAGLVLLAAGTYQFGLRPALMTDESLMNRVRQPVQTGRAWAERLEVPGVPNLYKVSDSLYRGAQPTEEGVLQLRALGIKTIVNLRTWHSDRDEIGQTHDVNSERITTQPWHVEDQDATRFLRIVADPAQAPVYVHCQRGADRTGTMCAIYRIVVQGWTKDEALAEMTQGGFGFYEGWKDLIETIRALDVETLRKGLSDSTVQ
jgi:protein tyrosine phosphatase (PTP) superfamily phosphohydrolase (DUF442 family)